MKTTFVEARAGFRAALLLCCVGQLLATPLASAAPPQAPAAVTVARALAQVAADAQRVQERSRKFAQVRALAEAQLQTASKAQQKLNASDPKIYVEIAARREELQAALETLDRLLPMNQAIGEGLSALETAIDLARARQSTAPTEIAQLESAEKLLESARSVSQPATHFVDSELAIVRGTATTHLSELAAIEQALIDTNRKSSGCDIHDIAVQSFEYPRPIYLWQRELRQPWFDANNGGYQPRPALYADLNGNGRIEAIVLLTQGSTSIPVGDCYWRGRGAIVVFEMDDKCAVHRLASIESTSTASVSIKGKALLVDQPYFVPTGAPVGAAPSCKLSGVQRFAWKSMAGKLSRTNP